MRKVTTLKKIEDTVQSNTNYSTNIDPAKPKFMATFPYPYMNGKLHLGHAFTMLKVDFECRWKQLNGYNVLFPFGFHCTGMPISAAAKKLEKELEKEPEKEINNPGSQYNILKMSGIPENEIINFVDPNYWVKYFPQLGLIHLKKLGVMVDTSRSFVTTELNPFYDSFVKWQFNKLHQKGYLKYGTRNSIFSPALDIQCQDHDRSKGEGIQIDNFAIIEINRGDEYIWIPYMTNFENQNHKVSTIILINNTKYTQCQNDTGKMVYMSEYLYQNLSGQKKFIKKIGEKILNFDHFENISLVKKYKSEYSNYLGGEIELLPSDSNINYNIVDNVELPSDIVIDRMDQICVVKPVSQWYIDYANVEWKNKAYECINQMKLSDPIRNGLSNTISWIKEWGVSRPFGLGTKLPLDTNFLIDSLSDSTIYPAYYTISNILHQDLYGQVSKFNPNDFTEQIWDYILLDIPLKTQTNIDMKDLETMRTAFKYFYPVDIRISGKDLMTNHLAMYIFNHVAIFDKDHWPVSINCNGWILVNGEKMSKSKGNFITVESATQENSVDAVRMTLADSGDNVDDANYISANAGDHCTLKLFSWIESFDKYLDGSVSGEYTELDTIFTNIFNKQIQLVKDHYDNFRYKMVIRDGFHNFNNLKEKYRIYSKYLNQPINNILVKYFSFWQVILMYPIIPHMSTHIWNNILKNTDPIQNQNITNILNFEINDQCINYYSKLEELSDAVRERVERLRKKNKIINKVVISCPKQDQTIETIIKSQFKFSIEFELGDKLNIQIN